MKIEHILLLALALTGAAACSYREYADADYPTNRLYVPSADEVMYINEPKKDNDLANGGGPVSYVVDEESDALVVNLSAVQSGIRIKPCAVEVYLAFSRINEMKADGTFDNSVVSLPEYACDYPYQLRMEDGSVSAPFRLSIDLDVLRDPRYIGRKLAVAVSVYSDEILVNEELATKVICIDPEFLR